MPWIKPVNILIEMACYYYEAGGLVEKLMATSNEKVKIFDRASAVEAIKQLGEDDLLFLNRLIIERLKLLSQAISTSLMAGFTVGDQVCFQASDGRELQGEVLQLHKKTVSIATDDGNRWNVAPGLLRLVKSAGDPR